MGQIMETQTKSNQVAFLCKQYFGPTVLTFMNIVFGLSCKLDRFVDYNVRKKDRFVIYSLLTKSIPMQDIVFLMFPF